jgi:hypothetical protein
VIEAVLPAGGTRVAGPESDQSGDVLVGALAEIDRNAGRSQRWLGGVLRRADDVRLTGARAGQEHGSAGSDEGLHL